MYAKYSRGSLNIWILSSYNVCNRTIYYSYYYIYRHHLYILFIGIHGVYTLFCSCEIVFCIFLDANRFFLFPRTFLDLGLSSSCIGLTSNVTKTNTIISFLLWTDQSINIWLINFLLNSFVYKSITKDARKVYFPYISTHTHK